MPQFSLRIQLTLLISILIIAVVSVTGFLNLQREEKFLINEDHRRAFYIAEKLANDAKPHLIRYDRSSIYKVLHDIVENRHIPYAMILDVDGIVLMHNKAGEVDKKYTDQFSKTALATKETTMGSAFRGENGILIHDIIVPISAAGIRLGTLRMGHVHTEIKKVISAAKRQLLVIGCVSILFGIVLANVITYFVARPIKGLIDATHRIGRGDLNFEIVERGQNEIATLARSFNKMTADLKRTTVSQQYLDNIFNSSADSIRVISPDGIVTKVNRSFETLLGLYGPDVVGKGCSNFLKYPFCGQKNCFCKRIQQGEQFVRMESEAILSDGRRIIVNISASPLIENGEIVGVIESIQDITAQKKAEDKQQQLQAQFLQAQKMESVGRLAGGVAHDFNNILSVILGYTDLLILKNSYHEDTKLIEIINKSARKATILIRQLLALSRKQLLEVKVLNLNTLIDDMLKMLGRLIGEDIFLEFLPWVDLDNIRADPSQIEQIIMNLAVNARDAMPKGGKLSIETRNVDLSASAGENGKVDYPYTGSHVQLIVTDNGSGMTKDVLENIFEPFYTTKEKEKGTGLGLSTVYAIVQQHKGFIKVQSDEKKGTSFIIHFPVTREKENIQEGSEKDVMRYGEETILVVDDENDVTVMLEDLLSTFGYRVVAASSGEEALQLKQQFAGRIDLLITDITMPGINGWQLARQLRNIEEDLKVIYISGYIKDIKHVQEMLHPQNAFLQKPFAPNALMKQIGKLLGHQKLELKS